MGFNGYLMSGDIAAARIDNDKLTILRPDLLPIYLARGGALTAWLESRAIDRHRPNSRILKKVLRLADTSDLAAVLRAHGAAITDNYWLLSDGEELTWDQVQFREDIFSEIALTGSFSSYNRAYTEAELASGSPELTNIGSYEKCWKLEKGVWWLYKAGNVLERFSELFICSLGKSFGFRMAEYEAEGEFVRTPDFTGGKLNYEPAAGLVGEDEDYVTNYDALTDLNPDIGRQYLDILYLDALVFNMDRHTGNYGVLRSRENGKVVSMAPNFDNNIALISRGYGADPGKTAGLLIDLFGSLIQEKGLHYRAPVISHAEVEKLAECILPGEEIDRKYVSEMVLERQERLRRVLG